MLHRKAIVERERRAVPRHLAQPPVHMMGKSRTGLWKRPLADSFLRSLQNY